MYYSKNRKCKPRFYYADKDNRLKYLTSLSLNLNIYDDQTSRLFQDCPAFENCVPLPRQILNGTLILILELESRFFMIWEKCMTFYKAIYIGRKLLRMTIIFFRLFDVFNAIYENFDGKLLRLKFFCSYPVFFNFQNILSYDYIGFYHNIIIILFLKNMSSYFEDFRIKYNFF